MDQPMKGAGGEQKGGGWEEEEEGEGVRANRLWSPHKDWPRTEGEDREVGGNWGRGRGDPLLPCPRNRLPPGSCSPSPGTPAQAGGDRTPTTVSFHHYLRPPPPSHPLPSMGDRSAPSSSLSSPSPSFTGKSWRRLLPASHSRHSAPCAPTHPQTHTPSPIGAPSCVCVSLLPRGVSIPPFLPCASLPRPGPRLLIVQTQFSSLWLWPRVESGRPEPPPPNLEGRAGRRVKGEPKRRVEQVPRVVRGIPGSSGFSCIHRTGRDRKSVV